MKKVIAIVLAAMLVMTMFAACGEAGTGAGVDLSGKKEEATATTIKVGTSGPLLGDYAVYGVAVANGLELAFEEINAMQTELKFESRAEDDEADSEQAVNAYNNLMDWGMVIMAGPTTSASAAAAAAKCNQDRVFMLTPSASDASVIAAGDNIFQICFTDPNQGRASAQYIKNNGLATKVGVIYDSSSPYSAGIYATFKAEAEALGLEIATVEAFTEDTKNNLNTHVTKCQQAGCDLIFLPIYTAEAVGVLEIASANSYAPKFFGCDGLDGILNVDGFDPALAEGVMLLTPFDATATDEKTQSFVKAYTEKYGIAPNQFAADAYDVGYAIYEACKATGVTADMDAKTICEKLVAHFTTTTFDGLTGLGMTWDETGAVSKEPMAVKIQKNDAGEYVYVGME